MPPPSTTSSQKSFKRLPALSKSGRPFSAGALCSSSRAGKKNYTYGSVIMDCPLRAGARQDKTKLL